MSFTESRSDITTLLENMGFLLRPHSFRLASLDLTINPASGKGSFSTLFAHFSKLPVLRTLKLRGLFEWRAPLDARDVISCPLSMTALENLELGPELDFPARYCVEFPALARLATTFPASRPLADVLDACPALRDLRLSLGDATGPRRWRHAESAPTLHARVGLLRAVRLTDVWGESLPYALAIFVQQAAHEFGIDFIDIDDALVLRAMGVLAHVPAPVHLEFTTPDERVQLTTTAGSGQKRVVCLPLTWQRSSLDAAVAAVWRAVLPASLDVFSTTWALWIRVCRDLVPAEQLRQLEISLPTEMPPQPDIPDVHLPGLRTLVLRAGPDAKEKTCVTRSWAQGLILSLLVERTLDELLLDDVELTNGEDDPPGTRDWHISYVHSVRYI
ncbi:hypothetical protein AURDEDRAFT_170414 [Auricularia subglabra TFB-10046 SS5]|nr:hypothetical protein AURDEDRAFT_170414 [Auricularia subglabra TFB-10046 SS5]